LFKKLEVTRAHAILHEKLARLTRPKDCPGFANFMILLPRGLHAYARRDLATNSHVSSVRGQRLPICRKSRKT